MEQLFYLGLPIALLLFLVLRVFKAKTKTVNPANLPTTFEQEVNQAFSNTEFYHLRKFWLAVSKMETGGYSSSLYLKYNNPWGMKFPTSRRNKVSGQTGSAPWAVYANTFDAAQDIILWMRARRFNPAQSSLEDFIAEMKRVGYFEEPYEQYLNLVKAWMQR